MDTTRPAQMMLLHTPKDAFSSAGEGAEGYEERLVTEVAKSSAAKDSAVQEIPYTVTTTTSIGYTQSAVPSDWLVHGLQLSLHKNAFVARCYQSARSDQ